LRLVAQSHPSGSVSRETDDYPIKRPPDRQVVAPARDALGTHTNSGVVLLKLLLGALFLLTQLLTSAALAQTNDDSLTSKSSAPAGPTQKPQPLGAKPPQGSEFQLTFDDEFDGDAIKHSLWNADYSNLPWCNAGACPPIFKGVAVANGTLSLQPTIDYDDFTDGSGRADINTGGFSKSNAKFSQRYGYFEWRAKLPHDSNGEGDGIWPCLWGLPIGKSGFPGGCSEGNEEVDVMENVLSTTNMQQVHFSVHDYCFESFSLAYPIAPVGDLSAAYHTYGLYWLNNGSSHGSMQVYFDGKPQGDPYVLDARAKLWDNGIYLLNQVIPCPVRNVPFFGGARCTSKTSVNPLLVDYVRVWQETPITMPPR
jgi:Glycosyl hydrolases family 16